MAQRIGDTHWHNGQKYTFIGQTVEKKTERVVSQSNRINTRKALSIREGPIRLDNKTSVEKAILNRRTEYIIPDFTFTVRNYRQYSKAIEYMQESIGIKITDKNRGKYDEEVGTRVYGLVGDKLNPNKKYLSYYYGQVDLNAMMRGEHVPTYIHGVDEEVWLKLGLDKRKLVKDNESILEWHPLFSENITEREITEHAIQKVEQIMETLFASSSDWKRSFMTTNKITYSQELSQELNRLLKRTSDRQLWAPILIAMIENPQETAVILGAIVTVLTGGAFSVVEAGIAVLSMALPDGPSIADIPEVQEWINNERAIEKLADAVEKSKEYPYKYILTLKNQSLIDAIQKQIRLIENLPVYQKGSLDPQSRYWDEVIKQLQMIADLNSKTKKYQSNLNALKILTSFLRHITSHKLKNEHIDCPVVQNRNCISCKLIYKPANQADYKACFQQKNYNCFCVF